MSPYYTILNKPQEIRTSLYHSKFYSLIYRLNALPEWRAVLGIEVPDLNMKDCEILLRGFAMLIASKEYAPSMTKFLNDFSRRMKSVPEERTQYLDKLFRTFLDACSALPPKAFYSGQGRFNISIFESVFNAVCEGPFARQAFVETKVKPELIAALKQDEAFMKATQKATADSTNVATRLRIAREKLTQ